MENGIKPMEHNLGSGGKSSDSSYKISAHDVVLNISNQISISQISSITSHPWYCDFVEKYCMMDLNPSIDTR